MNILSADMLFPECESCSVNVFVIQSRDKRRDWYCFSCGESFDTPRDSQWYGLNEISDRLSEAYVQCRIRGLSYEEAAQRLRVKAVTVRRYVSKAKRLLEETDRRHVATVTDSK